LIEYFALILSHLLIPTIHLLTSFVSLPSLLIYSKTMS